MKKQIHALIVLPWYKPEVGGVVHGVSRLVERLPARGVKLTLLLHQSYETPTKLGDDNGTEIFGFNTRGPSVDGHAIKPAVAFAVFLFRTVSRLRTFMQERGIDVVNVHYPSAQYFYFGLLKRWYGYPLAISLHGSDIQFGFDTAAANRMIYRHLMRSADLITGVSHALLTQAIIKVPDLFAKTVVVAGGARDAFFEAASVPIDTGDRPYILCVGRLHPVKGHDMLLRAFRIVKDHDTTNCRLVLAGGGPLESEIRAQIAQLGLQNDVVMAGSMSQEDLARMNRNALFTALASLSEGLPLTIIEAFATGRTVVATDVGGVKEIVHDRITGLLVPADNYEVMAEKLLWMISHPAERQKMEQQARALVSSGYTWDANADTYEQLLRELASKRT